MALSRFTLIDTAGSDIMPGCVLHAVGAELRVDSGAWINALKPYRVFCRGEKMFRSRDGTWEFEKVSGFSCEVSSREGDLAEEVQDAISFLTYHREYLACLSSTPGVDSVTLDFGCVLRLNDGCDVQCESLPPALLKLAGELGIQINLSLYPPA
jgi:hypothetical protein